jgi:transcriptional regulator with XRE-family HTH domain
MQTSDWPIVVCAVQTRYNFGVRSATSTRVGSGKEMTFGERVRELRRSRGLTLRELAPKVGVGFTYLSRVENGRLNYGDFPSESLIQRLANALDAHEDELLILAEKIPERIKQRVFERPEEFKVLAELSDTELKKLVATIDDAREKRTG